METKKGLVKKKGMEEKVHQRDKRTHRHDDQRVHLPNRRRVHRHDDHRVHRHYDHRVHRHNVRGLPQSDNRSGCHLFSVLLFPSLSFV